MDGNSSDQTISLAKFVKFREERFEGPFRNQIGESIHVESDGGCGGARDSGGS